MEDESLRRIERRMIKFPLTEKDAMFFHLLTDSEYKILDFDVHVM